MRGAVHQRNGRRLCVYLPLGHLIKELFLPLHEAEDVPVGYQAAAGRPLSRVTHSGVRGIGEQGAARACPPRRARLLPPLSVDLICDLEVFQGVLNLALSERVDMCCCGTLVPVGRGHGAVVGRVEEGRGGGGGTEVGALVTVEWEGLETRAGHGQVKCRVF